MHFIVEGMFPKNSVVMLAAESGGGKSTLVAELMACVASGRDFLGRKVEKGNVILFDDDNEQFLIRDRFDRINVSHRSFAADVEENVSIVSQEGAVALDDFLHADVHASLLVIDVMRQFFTGSENDSENTNNFVNKLRCWAEKTQSCVVMLHHFNKAQPVKNGQPPMELGDRVRGSTSIRGGLSALYVLEHWKNESKLNLSMYKCRWGPPMVPELISLEFSDVPDKGLLVKVEDRGEDNTQEKAYCERVVVEARRVGWVSFKRKDVEQLLGVCKSLAAKVVAYGQESGRFAKLRGKDEYVIVNAGAIDADGEL
jgi:hypothetical protein